MTIENKIVELKKRLSKDKVNFESIQNMGGNIKVIFKSVWEWWEWLLPPQRRFMNMKNYEITISNCDSLSVDSIANIVERSL